jgi:hypothetical protein
VHGKTGHRVNKKSRKRHRPQVEFENWEKVPFFSEDRIFFAKLAFSAVIYLLPNINLKGVNLFILARREFEVG